MKQMKTTIAAAIALAACASTQLFAQNVKQDTMTFSLTLQGQASVSTSPTVINAGNFSQGPLYYKTSSKRFTQVDLLKAIAYVMHNKNASFYSSQASLVLVQGELGGFWNIGDALAISYPDFEQYNPADNGLLNGNFNQIEDSTFFTWSQDGTDYIAQDVFFPDADSISDPYDYENETFSFLDFSDRTSISDNVNENVQLDTGRHFLPVPFSAPPSSSESPLPTTGEYPVGHMQPWGQIYVKDPGHKDSSGDPLCENVTFFFYLAVTECYDCFYLSSFISDATFKNINASQSGPPCCTAPGFLTGHGVDRYYLSLSFDNTIENEYLNPAWTTNDETLDSGNYYYEYVGFTGVDVTSKNISSPADGLTPDLLKYSDPIRSHLGVAIPYETRFTLNGIVTYTWNLVLVSPTDAAYDYVGNASFAANGFGFVGLVCDLITGSATFSERVVKDIGCCDDEPWWEAVSNSQFGLSSLSSGWYGVGADNGDGYFNPDFDEYNPYPYYNVVGGESYETLYIQDLPDQDESPLNPGPALTEHGIVHPSSQGGLVQP